MPQSGPGAQFGNGLVRIFLILAANDDNGCALFQEALGNALADAAGSAGDNRNFSLNASHD